MNRPVYKRYRYLDQNENAWYEDSAYITDLEKYCDELESKLEKYKYPKFVPCICGYNRRHISTNLTGNGTVGRPERMFTYTCIKCGRIVTGYGNANSIREWNNTMNYLREHKKDDRCMDQNDKAMDR